MLHKLLVVHWDGLVDVEINVRIHFEKMQAVLAFLISSDIENNFLFSCPVVETFVVVVGIVAEEVGIISDALNLTEAIVPVPAAMSCVTVPPVVGIQAATFVDGEESANVLSTVIPVEIRLSVSGRMTVLVKALGQELVTFSAVESVTTFGGSSCGPASFFEEIIREIAAGDRLRKTKVWNYGAT